MLVKSKGNTVEIAPGVRFVENNHSRGGVYSLETITEVEIIDNYEINGKSYKQYRWQARNIETGEIGLPVTENNLNLPCGIYGKVSKH